MADKHNYEMLNGLGIVSKANIKLKSGNDTYEQLTTQTKGATVSLFILMLRCLRGENNYWNERPGFLYLYDENHVKLINHGVGYDDSPKIYSGESEELGPAASITYHFLIPDTIIQEKNVKYLAIHSSKDDGTVYAEIELQDELIIHDKTNIDIEWTLVILNK